MSDKETARKLAYAAYRVTFENPAATTGWNAGFHDGFTLGWDARSEASAWQSRCEELEVVAAALYLGHADAKEQFDMYRSSYILTVDDDEMWRKSRQRQGERMSDKFDQCYGCGMPLQTPNEYHTDVHCQMFKQTRDSERVRVNIDYTARNHPETQALETALRHYADDKTWIPITPLAKIRDWYWNTNLKLHGYDIARTALDSKGKERE